MNRIRYPTDNAGNLDRFCPGSARASGKCHACLQSNWRSNSPFEKVGAPQAFGPIMACATLVLVSRDPFQTGSNSPFEKSWGRQSPTIGMSEAMDHQADHGEGDHHLGDLWQHLVVFGEASPPSKPTE